MASRTTEKTRSWRHSRRVAWRKVAGEAVILDVDTAAYYSLRDAGCRMWELIGESRSEEEIVRRVVDEYDAAPERVREDLGQLLVRLKKERLVDPA